MSTPAPLPSRAAELPNAWKEELHERLREHRQRRSGDASPSESFQRQDHAQQARSASRVAERVAERWKDAPSYQELLAATAAAAGSAAQAALAAQAAAEAVMAGWPLASTQPNPAPYRDPSADPFFAESDRPEPTRPAPDSEPAPSAFPGRAVVEHYAPLPERTPPPAREPAPSRTRAFVDAFAEAVVPAAQSLPAKLIEFPRELVAPRKQRPRLAEGPLLEEPAGTGLRIFEVDSNGAADPGSRAGMEEPAAALPSIRFADSMANREKTIRTGERKLSRRRGGFLLPGEREAPQPAEPAGVWSSIRLGEHPRAATPDGTPLARRPDQGYRAEAAPALTDLAPIGDRLMAALVDGALVSVCFLLAVLVFASSAAHPPAGKPALLAGLLALGALGVLYGWLFLSWGGGGSTPGMRYARIALCTFRDENPTRKQLRNRIPATALALLPLGVGVLWALLDEDKLGWHDRMTRTYQRSYR